MRERDIFIAALEQDDPAQRAAYLDGACGPNVDLRQRVERLLQLHAEAGGFLEHPPVERVSTGEHAPAPDATIGHATAAEGLGTRIGPYKLLQRIGEGGMGVVWMAEQQEPIRRLVALKVIKAGMDSAQVVARFEAERQALALMDHPHIAKVFDAGTTEAGRPYFVMELVKGIPLTKYCDEHRLTPRQRLELFVPVCQALQHAHQKGIIHRDLKPSNVLVAPYDGRPVVKVIDFGVAKATGARLTERTLFTEFGAVIGTLEYMSPEQAELNNQDIDTRSDVYSLGVLLYELLTGTTPLDRARLKQAAFTELLRQIREVEPPMPSTRLSTSELLPSISAQRQTEPARLTKQVRGELDWIVMKALDKDRSRRYETANGLAHDVQRYLADEPVEACPPSAGYRLRKFAHKHRRLLTTALAFAMLLVVGTAIAWLLAVRALVQGERADREAALARANEARAGENEQRARANEAWARREKLLSDRRYYVAEMKLAGLEWHHGQLDLVQQRLRGQEPPSADDPDRRGFEWYCLDRLCHLELRTLREQTSSIFSVAFSPDGKGLAVGTRDATVELWDPGTGRKVRTWRGDVPEAGFLTFSADGGRVASGGWDNAVQVWDAATGRQTLTYRAPTGRLSSLAISPDGTRLAVGTSARTVHLCDAVTGEELYALRGHTDQVHQVAFSPDGKLLASAGWDRTVRVWDAATGRERCMLPDHGISGLVFSPDGKLLAGGGTDRAVRVFDVATGREQVTLRGHAGVVTSVAFSPDGRRLASGSRDKTVRVWDADTGRELLTLRGHTAPVLAVAFSPDGRWLATTSGDSVKLWDAATNPEPLVLPGHTAGVWCVAFSPDGRLLASGSVDRTVKVRDATSGLTVHTLLGHAGPVSGLVFSPDGTRLASGSWDGTMKLWDVGSGRELLMLRGHAGYVSGLGFSPDGRWLASSGEDNTVKLWDAVTGRELCTCRGHRGAALCVAFSPDGKRVASGGTDRTVKLWEPATGNELATWNGHAGWVQAVAFSRDGRRLATASRDNTAKVWDAADGRELCTLKGHASYVYSVAFSPDGERVASGGMDDAVRLWDVTTGQETLTLAAHTNAVRGVTFSRDGKQLASGSEDTTVAVWDASPLTDGQRTQREARCLLHFHFARSRSQEEMVAGVRQDPTAGPEVRLQALAWAPPYWEGRIDQKAQAVVQPLLDRPLVREEVLASLRGNTTLPEPVRERALALAAQWPPSLYGLNEASWVVVQGAHATPAQYREAVRLAEEACRLDPGNGIFLNTLGVGQYRLGRHAEALATLTRADELNAARHGGSLPADLAFLGMAHYQLGQRDPAAAALRRLRETMKTSEFAHDIEAEACLREAEALIDGTKKDARE